MNEQSYPVPRTREEAIKLARAILSRFGMVDTALNEALAQAEQQGAGYTTGHCENKRQPGGCHLHNLQCGWPKCDRRNVARQPQAEQQGAGAVDIEVVEAARTAYRAVKVYSTGETRSGEVLRSVSDLNRNDDDAWRAAIVAALAARQPVGAQAEQWPNGCRADPTLCVHTFGTDARVCMRCGWDFRKHGEIPEPQAEQEGADALPPLPPMGLTITGDGPDRGHWYSAQQMQDYAHSAIAARQPVVMSNSGSSEAEFVEDGAALNCPACGGSGHVDDARQPVGEPYCIEVRWPDGVTTYPKQVPPHSERAVVTPLYTAPPAAVDLEQFRDLHAATLRDMREHMAAGTLSLNDWRGFGTAALDAVLALIDNQGKSND